MCPSYTAKMVVKFFPLPLCAHLGPPPATSMVDAHASSASVRRRRRPPLWLRQNMHVHMCVLITCRSQGKYDQTGSHVGLTGERCITRGRGLTRFLMVSFTTRLYSNISIISTIDSTLPPSRRPNIPPKSPVQYKPPTQMQTNAASLRLRLKSSNVVDTLGHTSTPIFSVRCRFFSLFPSHINDLQVLAHGINPVFPQSFWFVLDMVVHLQIHGLLRYSIVFRA